LKGLPGTERIKMNENVKTNHRVNTSQTARFRR
jgi:hypothetical protein